MNLHNYVRFTYQMKCLNCDTYLWIMNQDEIYHSQQIHLSLFDWLLLFERCVDSLLAIADKNLPSASWLFMSAVSTRILWTAYPVHILITTMRTAIFISLLCLDLSTAQVLEGLLPLDIISFDKIVSKFEYSLIKFDTGYPTGDKHKTFGKLAVEVCKFGDYMERSKHRAMFCS